MIRFARGWDDARADELGRIAVPTLVLWGAEDQLINVSAAQSFAEGLPNDQVVILPGIGHLPMEEAPDATAGAIRRFLGARGLGPQVSGNPERVAGAVRAEAP